jgi:AcrR family transcriptional regulator
MSGDDRLSEAVLELFTDTNVNLRVLRTRKCLFDGLVTLMRNRNFGEITISQICKAANVHRSTFYSHFEDKTHLLTFGLSDLIDDITSRIGKPGAQKISEPFYHVMVYRQFYRSILNSMDDKISKLFREQIALDFRTKMKSVSVGNGINLQIKSRICAGAFVAVIDWWISEDNPCSLETVSNEFQNTLTNGLWYDSEPNNQLNLTQADKTRLQIN